jgi:hypothetical protein
LPPGTSIAKRQSSMSRRLFAVIAACVVAGCFDSGDSQGCSSANGLAGSRQFKYECTSAADPGCDVPENGFGPVLPQAVARGARFRLTSDGGPVTPVSRSSVKTDGRDFVALRDGNVGFVIQQGTEVLDAVRLLSAEPERIIIAASRRSVPGVMPPSASLKLALDTFGGVDRDHVRAIAMNHAFPYLAGTIPVAWDIDHPEVASYSIEDDGTCLVTAHSQGTATLTATMDQLHTTLSIVVGQSSIETSGDAGPSDAGDDASIVDAGGDT